MAAGAAASSESQRAREKADELRRKAERLERRAVTFEQGRQGEVLVAEALARLVPAGYAVIDDIRWPGSSRANIDHIVFGPSGMFVIDAKNWSGNVTVRGGVLRQNGRLRTSHTDKAATMADALQAHLGASVGVIQPVIAMAGQRGFAPATCGRTHVVGLDGLAAWLFRQPEIWPQDHVVKLAAWLPHVLKPASGGSQLGIAMAPAVTAAANAVESVPAASNGRPQVAVAPTSSPPRRTGRFAWLRR